MWLPPQRFHDGTSGLPPCDGKEVKTEAAWRFAVNVIIEAMSCQGDDGGKTNADALSNRMSATVRDLKASCALRGLTRGVSRRTAQGMQSL